ncbi:MAG: hypothetical protein CVV13_14180 [Gammaproteobacteria bacterium HGW-Gammaproteobacteria-3]|nr:MAG: hypothetical protein CVV13_14180 [Gammaproteobacteria bacterium HGW-Gammaproteobacteria-3]
MTQFLKIFMAYAALYKNSLYFCLKKFFTNRNLCGWRLFRHMLTIEPLAKLSVISRKQFHRQPLAVDFLR